MTTQLIGGLAVYGKTYGLVGNAVSKSTLSQHRRFCRGAGSFPIACGHMSLEIGPVGMISWTRIGSKDKGVSRQSPANPRHSWLPDLGSNQGPTD